MALLTSLSLLFLLVGSPGALGVWTLHKVLGEKGASVTVPCHYDPKYKDHSKYWCRGYQWATCLVMAWSTSTQSGGKVTIRDEPSQQLFTVTMSNLTQWDTNKYWCAVKIGSVMQPDIRASVFLSVTSGSVGLSVPDSTVAAAAGDSVTVRCLYSGRYALSPRKWCRANDWGSCVTAEEAGEDGARRVLVDDDGTGVFAVTLKELTEQDRGWYWCASGDAQVPVHIAVMAPATATLPVTARSSCRTTPRKTSASDAWTAASAVSAVPPATEGGSSALSITLPPSGSAPPSTVDVPRGSTLPSTRESKAVSTLSSTMDSPVGSTRASEPAAVTTSSGGSALLTPRPAVLQATKTSPSSPLTSAGLMDRGFQKVHRSHVARSLWMAGAVLLVLATAAVAIWKRRHGREIKSSCEMEEIVTNLTDDAEQESSCADPDADLSRLPAQREPDR